MTWRSLSISPDFGALSAKLPASELVELLNFVFTTFDDALEAGSFQLNLSRIIPSTLESSQLTPSYMHTLNYHGN